MPQAGGQAAGALFIDTYQFWLISIVAIFVLRLIAQAKLRQYVFAGLNLTFLVTVLGSSVGWVVAALCLVWMGLRVVSASSKRIWLPILLLVTSTATFFAYKAGLFRSAFAGSAQSVLVAIGFSFVFLRVFDVVRAVQDRRHQAPSLGALLNYLLPFHMLAAGPIQAYDDFARQPGGPEPLDVRATLNAAQRVAGGLFKKFVLAYALQKTFLTDLQADGIWFFVEVQLLLLWLYLDFSAYSDIAVGLGRLMGVSTPENFNRPWLSRSLIDFWDRWHISLSQWIRRNLFIPIQLNLMRRYPVTNPVKIATLAIGVSFFMAGLWHGLSAGWLLWGGMHAAGLVTNRLYGGWLQRRLSPERLARYRENSLATLFGRVLTLEYAAAAFAVVFLVK